MNFVKQVEEQLRDLGTESRRRHPGVKEAAERGILSLRSLQNKYVVAVRQATRASSSQNGNKVKVAHPTTAIFQSQDILRPFLLAANYPDVGNKVLNLSLDGIQALLAGDAVCRDDGVNVVRVLNIQASVCAASIQVKGHGSMMMGMHMPSAGSVVNAGVGTISSLGNSILSGFGFKNGNSQPDQGQVPANAQKNGSDYTSSEQGTVIGARTVASAVHTSSRSLKEDVAISIRIMQTVTMIVDSSGIELSEEVLSQCIAICLLLVQCDKSERNAGTSVGGIGGKIQRSKESSASIGNHNIGSNSSTSGNGVSGGQKVSGAATATMRQVMSTLFDRANHVENVNAVGVVANNGSKEDSSLKILASKTLLDLCDLAECKNSRGGPFGQAMTGQQRIHKPTQSACFDLIEMILEQQVDLFSINIQHTEADPDFFSILKDRICPLVTRLLAECTLSAREGPSDVHLGRQTENYQSNDEHGERSLNEILKLTSLSSCIIKRYGNAESLRLQCSELLTALANLVVSATNLLRDSHDFEDGFVYSGQLQGEDRTEYKDHQQESKYDSSQTMWAASIAIELIYTFISEDFNDLTGLFSRAAADDSETLLSIVISVVCDFAVVASSCKSAISQLVDVVGEFQSEVPGDSFPVNTKSSKKSSRGVFLCNESFDVQKIHPTLITSARERSGSNVGASVWTALNCVLILWKRLQYADTNRAKSSSCKMLIENCFAPSLAVMQHFLRRCPASSVICRSTMSGYLFLSRVVLPFCDDGDFKRKVTLTSICKLTLPSWAKEEARGYQELSSMAATLLFQVLYLNSNDIGTDWFVIVNCLAQLSMLRSNDSMGDQNITTNFSRIGLFSKSLEDESLKVFTSSLVEFSAASTDCASEGLHRDSFGSVLYSSTRKVLQHTRLSTKEAAFGCLPFGLVLLVNVSIENGHRFRCFGQEVMAHFGEQASKSAVEAVRTFSLDVLSYMVTLNVAINSEDRKRPAGALNEDILLEPLCNVIGDTTYAGAAELGLMKLKQIIEAGYNIIIAWPTIIKALAAIAEAPRDNSDGYACCTIAFGCLKLIVDDFLNELPDQEMTRISLLDCCASFGSSRYDINTSLTATGMLWSIADQDSSPSAVDHVLSKLAFLATDDRVEMRNCVVNTLFSCVVGLGQKFTAVQWERVFTNTIFAVLDQVQEQGTSVDESGELEGLEENKSPERYKVSIHHSRDSASKQWATTQVLTLRGIERVLRQYFDKLLDTTLDTAKVSSNANQKNANWFENTWCRIIKQSLDCGSLLGGRETLDLRLAGVDLMVLCCQVSSKGGFIAADARVGTNMQVVNGALRTVRTPPSSPPNSPQRDLPAVIEEEDIDPSLRREFFDEAFRALARFGDFLRKNEKSITGSSSNYIDSLHLQVLTKLGQGLSQLYECCKDAELSPQYSCGELEEQFVDFVTLIMTMASGGPSSKFLTQAQRPCLELLKTMSLNCSSRAFEILTRLGSDAILKQSQEGCEIDILHVEASKLMSQICSDDEAVVILKRTSTGLIAKIDLPGAPHEDSNNVDEGEMKCNAELEVDSAMSVGDSDPHLKSSDCSSPCSLGPERDDVSNENIQLKEINAELMRQVEKLRSQNERLEQQVAVLSEGSAYI